MDKNKTEKITVAAFDFDGTITYRDSLLPFLFFTAGPVKAVWKLFFLLPWIIGFVMGVLSRQETKERVISSFYKGVPIEELRALGKKYADEKLSSQVKQEADERIKWHQKQGHKTVLISASVDIYLAPWAKAKGFNELICTQLETDEKGCLTGKILGNNCWGVEKTHRLEKLLGPKDKYILYAYGDSRGDLELLASADYAFYRRMPMEKNLK